MKLSAVNYSSEMSSKLKTTLDKEDDKILQVASEFVREKQMGDGGIIISEVLHTDLVNLNHRSYLKKGMAESVKSFINPYLTPFLMHHESGGGGMFSGADPNLIAVGTNIVAEYFGKTTDTPNGIASGYVKVATHIAKDSMIGGVRTLSAIQSRRLMALSIGANVSDKNYTCSVCKNPRRSGDCEHELGETYKGKLCFAEVMSPVFKEYSGVYNPSDIIAAIRKLYVSESNGQEERHEIDQLMGLWNMGLYEIKESKQFPSAEIPGSQAPVTESEPDNGGEEVNAEAIKKMNALLSTLSSKVDEQSKVIDSQNELIADLADKLNTALETIKQYEEGDEGEGEPTTTTEGEGGEPGEPEAEPTATEGNGEPAATEPAPATQTESEGEGEPSTQESDPAGEGDPAPTTESDPPPATEPAPAESSTGEPVKTTKVQELFSISHMIKKNSLSKSNTVSKNPFSGIGRIR